MSLSLSSLSFASVKPKVIYGEDNRVDLYETQAIYAELAMSTAAMISGSNLDLETGRYVISGSTLESRGICTEERFSDQITPAVCSGFLVGEDLLVTAGHCVTNQSDCDSYRWVFDFATTSANQQDYQVPVNSVYECKEIVERAFGLGVNDDYSLIRLDRKVKDRRVLSFRKSGKISINAELLVIGHPTGLPVKIADGAYVRDASPSAYFTTNLDTFAGNSGSAVFNVDTLKVEGILVRGAQDYAYDGDKNCKVPNVCEMNECGGEDVTRITNIRALKNL